MRKFRVKHLKFAEKPETCENALIKVRYDSDNPTVSGRELHGFLEVNTRYNDWFVRMVEYGFTEGTDFVLVTQKRATNNPKNPTTTITDHALTLDMAKELAMLQRTEKGKQVRQYFITVEKEWNSPDKIIARALKIADARMNELRARNRVLFAQITQQQQIIGELKPKADYVDTILSSVGTITVTQIAADYGISARKLNRILHEERVQRWINGQWVLYHKHMGKGFTESESIPITRRDGSPDARLFTRWTQKGRLLINQLLNARGIYAE